MRIILNPKPDFYKLYTPLELDELIMSIKWNHEIPIKYSFFGEGAHIWDSYAERLYAEEGHNAINTSELLLSNSRNYIDHILRGAKGINVIDITIGNLLPIKSYLEYLHEKHKLNAYVALDASPEMLNIAERNVTRWFGDNINFQSHRVDINTADIRSILSFPSKPEDNIANMFFYLGGTSMNFEYMDDGFRNIYWAMNPHDLLVHSIKLDSKISRRYFDFNPEPGVVDASTLSPRHSVALNLMNIDMMSGIGVEELGIAEHLYDVEKDYDESLRQRYIRVRLKRDIRIIFSPPGGKERIVDIDRNESILLVRMWHQTSREVLAMLDRTGFDTLLTSHTEDGNYLLTVSRKRRF